MRGALALAGCLLAAVAHAQPLGISVSPVQLDLGQRQTSASLTLSNSTDRPHRFQVQVMRWTQTAAGEDVYTPVDGEILANPPLFELPSGASQVVRLGLLSAPPDAMTNSYRVYLSEVPTGIKVDAADGSGSAVQVLIRLGVPLFVAPRQSLRRDLRWSALPTGTGLVVVAANHGNVRERRARVKVTGEADGEVLYAGDGYRDVLPGSRWTIEIPTARPLPSHIVIESIAQDDQTDRSVVRVQVQRAASE